MKTYSIVTESGKQIEGFTKKAHARSTAEKLGLTNYAILMR